MSYKSAITNSAIMNEKVFTPQTSADMSQSLGESTTIGSVPCLNKGQACGSRKSGHRIGKWIRSLVVAIVVLGASAPMARAADDEDMDGRLSGYSGKKVAIEKSSATPVYLLFFFLTIVGCIPMFKAAKRD